MSDNCGFDYLNCEDLVGVEQRASYDSKQNYKVGDIVLYNSLYYRAMRDISPPWYSFVADTNYPSDSNDSWRLISDAEAHSTATLGEDAVVTIPTVGANYTDAKTVAAVQSSLVKKGYDVGDTGPNNDGVDGILGPKTKAAIKKMQAAVGQPQTGKIDEGVIMALGVTPGVLPPGVTIQGRAAVQAQVALDAATLAEHAETPSDVQIAAQQTVDAAPPAPPELKQAAQKALAKAKAATTPAQVKAAAADVATAAKDVHTAVKPSWWVEPAWSGGLPRWQVGTVAGGATIGLGALLFALVGGKK